MIKRFIDKFESFELFELSGSELAESKSLVNSVNNHIMKKMFVARTLD